MFRLFFTGVLLILLYACQNTPQTTKEGKNIEMRHASLLQIEEADSFTRVTIFNAWKPGKIARTYLLVPHNYPLPSLPEGTIIRTPLQHMALASTVHAALFIDLRASNHIAAIADTAYIVSQRIKNLLHSHARNMGSSMQPDIEVLHAAQADAILVSPFENAGYGPLERLNIPLIECADYMETSPLARAEWMRFYGRLVNKGVQADSIFALIEKEYNTLKKQVDDANPKRPTVFCDLLTGNTWYQPGGASTMGRFIADAGGNYLWNDRTESGSLPLNIETVYVKAAQADLWLVKYGQKQNLSYEQMTADCPQYKRFRAWKEHRIRACNTLHKPFYEEIPFHPEKLLRELISLFHPQLLQPVSHPYYTPL